MKAFKITRNLSYRGIFWGWNLIFILTVYFGILPYIGIPLIVATFDGDIALDFCLTFFTLVAIPLGFCYLGGRYFNSQPVKLIRLFYGVEAPLFTWCLVRLFIVRELTLASGLLLGTILICVFAYGANLLKQEEDKLKLHPWVEVVTHSLILVVGIYLGVVLLFYAIPVAINVIIWLGNLLIAFFSFDWLPGLMEFLTAGYFLSTLIILGFSFLLFLFSCSLFVLMPFALSTLYIHLGWKTSLKFSSQYPQKNFVNPTIIVIALWLALLFVFNQQPQVKAFALVDDNPQDRQTLLASSPQIRRGLVNANLSPYRYISTIEDNNHIFAMYRNLKFNDTVSGFLQQTYNQLVAPFLYQGSKEDVTKSATAYAQLFDIPLQKAERKSVRHAIKSTSIIDEAKAGLLNIDQKKVWLEKQEVTVKPQADSAEVEIHEVYNNQTPDVEEIFYYFSLPESAVITGLWLSESDNLNDRFSFQVSPRGAAQEVYNNQVRRTRPVDPALLEQVGVGQYRLRAFPVPPRLSSENIRNLEKQRKMHLWLTYQVMKQENGWALPKLAEKRNIYWTRKTQRIRNGKRKWFLGNLWLEDFLPDSTQIAKQSHRVDLNDGYTVKVQPLNKQDYVLPHNQKYALVLDTSYSMQAHHQEVQDTLTWLQNNLSNNDLDVYIADVQSSKAQRIEEIQSLNIDKQLFFGTLQVEDMLNQFQQLKGEKNYDALLIITDEGSYELSQDKQTIPPLDSPLWMIHLGGEFPRAYNDVVLQALQNSNGGVADNVDTVFKRLATEKANDMAVIDGYSWTVSNSSSPETTTQVNSNNLKPITARQFVYYLSRKGNQQLSLEELDNIHQVAKNYQIVTPYSSMIVLVNDEQREQLRLAEAKEDRFDREVEKGFEDLDSPFNPLETNVSGVPEPNIWLLFFLVISALSVVFYRQQRRNIID